jgi:HKD family nuclease
VETQVVSDQLRLLLDNCHVQAAVFTTYTFDPEFFELDVIPLLVPEGIAYSTDERIKEFQVRETLREAGLELEVFFDEPVVRAQGERSPRMEYRFHGVRRTGNAFHAKLNFILVHDNYYDKDCLLVGAGSNNLTKSGWWDNIECQHWEVCWPGEIHSRFLARLKEDINYLKSQRLLATPEAPTALDQVEAFLNAQRGSTSVEPVAYFGMRTDGTRQTFPAFMRQQSDTLANYGNWTVEIISPFFAQDTENREHDLFTKLGAREIHLLLPTDQDGNALVDPRYFRHIEDEEDIHWAEWHPDTLGSMGMQSKHYRRLHAKIYHFYNKRQSWAFVGSVNFSRKAMRENAEAGFFVRLPEAGPLLRPLSRKVNPDQCIGALELLPGEETPEDDRTIPQLQLVFDWRSKTLTAAAGIGESYRIRILDPTGAPVTNRILVTDAPTTYPGDTAGLEGLLANGSLVTVTGRDIETGEKFPRHQVMLQQIGWSHKPLDLPALTAQQILSIYAGIDPERRQLLLLNAKIRQLVKQDVAGEVSLLGDESEIESFISEYAEIFNAFRQLRRHLHTADEQGNTALVDYYLTGAGMDSLPSLLEQLNDRDTIAPVTTYLVYLSALGIYREATFSRRAGVKKCIKSLKRQIVGAREPGFIQLDQKSPAERTRFFDWFEKQFYKEYRQKEAAE